MNECGENIRETKQEENKCGLKRMSRKERFFYLGKQTGEIKDELTSADTVESVSRVLNKLTYLMNNVLNDSELSDVKGISKDVYDTIESFKLHDFTRSELEEMLQKLLDKIEEVIEQEKQKEKARKLQELLLELAENAEEIAKIIDIQKIFG